jgi:hypothetical protein
MRKGLANARETGGGEENVKATVVVRGKIEAPSAMLGPRLAGEGRDDKLAGGWMGGRQSRRGHDGDHGGRKERG